MQLAHFKLYRYVLVGKNMVNLLFSATVKTESESKWELDKRDGLPTHVSANFEFIAYETPGTFKQLSGKERKCT